jgi:hypothetical protein
MRALSNVGLLLVVSTSLAQGCSSDVARAAGSVGASCGTDAACNNGLVCLSQICVQPAAADAGGGAGSGGIRDGAGGAAGGGLGMACTAATTMLAPPGGHIADFTDPDGGLDVAGGFFAYPMGSPAAPTVSVAGGALHIVESRTFGAATQYVGGGVYFNGCMDATAFSGVSFTISGSLSGCSMQYATGDVEHQDATIDSHFATGPAGAYPPQSTITSGEVTTAPQTLTMPFTGSTMAGDPQTPLDTSKLVLLLWQFTVPAGAPATSDAASSGCVGDITIDNLTFY